MPLERLAAAQTETRLDRIFLSTMLAFHERSPTNAARAIVRLKVVVAVALLPVVVKHHRDDGHQDGDGEESDEEGHDRTPLVARKRGRNTRGMSRAQPALRSRPNSRQAIFTAISMKSFGNST